jgi:hypothetical protein
LETTGLIRFGLKRNTPGKWLRSSSPIGRRLATGEDGVHLITLTEAVQRALR